MTDTKLPPELLKELRLTSSKSEEIETEIIAAVHSMGCSSLNSILVHIYTSQRTISADGVQCYPGVMQCWLAIFYSALGAVVMT